MEEKYINLLLKGCLKVSENTPLFINYNKVNKNFVDKIVEIAKTMGVNDIYLDEVDSYYLHNILMNSSLKDLEKNKLFDCKIWDKYAKKDAAFLMLCSEIPHLMEDVDPERSEKVAELKLKTKPIYRKKQLKGEIPWCIAAVPNEEWAKDLFPKCQDAMAKFWRILADICMLNEDDPIKSWQEHLDKQAKLQQKLNDLQITKLHYKNSLGTDLEVFLSNIALWSSAASGKWIVNMPSYEVFTTPDYTKTNGIVYASKPLIYNGQLITDFYLKFQDGKVVDYDAKSGKEVLKNIIEGDEYSAYLGEAALVNYDSPISNTNILFNTTLIDENAASHLALGSGFLECLKDGNNLNKKELEKAGLNTSTNHVDFMIGTKDLLIEAETKNGQVIIMQDGNIVI